MQASRSTYRHIKDDAAFILSQTKCKIKLGNYTNWIKAGPETFPLLRHCGIIVPPTENVLRQAHDDHEIAGRRKPLRRIKPEEDEPCNAGNARENSRLPARAVASGCAAPVAATNTRFTKSPTSLTGKPRNSWNASRLLSMTDFGASFLPSRQRNKESTRCSYLSPPPLDNTRTVFKLSLKH